MSVEQMALVWKHQFSKAEQSVMLALTDHAHDDGTNIFPSKARIAWKTDYSKMQIYRVIKELTEKGLLILVRKSSQHRPNEYKINWKKAIPKEPFRDNTTMPLDNSGVTIEPRGVTFETSRDNIAMLSEPLFLNHQFQPSDILSHWKKLFPNKRQPKQATHKAKILTRLNNIEFVDYWEAAMLKASKSKHLQSEGWFDLEYFVRNDENILKILDGKFDGFDKQINQNGTLPDASNYTADLEARREKARENLRKVQT